MNNAQFDEFIGRLDEKAKACLQSANEKRVSSTQFCGVGENVFGRILVRLKYYISREDIYFAICDCDTVVVPATGATTCSEQRWPLVIW